MPDRDPLTHLSSMNSPADRMFPTLSAEQIDRAAVHGRIRTVHRGEVLVEPGAKDMPFFIIKSGRLDLVRPGNGDHIVATLRRGQFTGETNTLAGRRGLVRITVSEGGEVVYFGREQLLGLVQTDSQLSEIVMRAFIHRRVELIARGYGDAVVLGSTHSSGTLR